jgi:adenylate cyclase
MLGFIYLFKRHHEKALKEVNLAIELNPNGADIYMFLAIILNFSGESEEAIGILDRVRRLNPITPPGYYSVLGAAYRNTGRYEKSIEVCIKSIHYDPDQLGPYIVMAGSYSLLNHFDEARQAVNEILRIDPRYSVGKFRLSMPFKDKEELEFHVEAMRKAGLSE